MLLQRHHLGGGKAPACRESSRPLSLSSAFTLTVGLQEESDHDKASPSPGVRSPGELGGETGLQQVWGVKATTAKIWHDFHSSRRMRRFSR